MSISSKNVIAAARKAHRRNPGSKWRDFYRGFTEGFGWMLTHKDQKECARHLAKLLDTQFIYLKPKDRAQINAAIMRHFPKYDPSVESWPACLGEEKP